MSCKIKLILRQFCYKKDVSSNSNCFAQDFDVNEEIITEIKIEESNLDEVAHFQSSSKVDFKELAVDNNESSMDENMEPISNEQFGNEREKLPGEYCDKTFDSSKFLKSNVEVIHKNLKKHKCDKCVKNFIYQMDSKIIDI